MGIYVICSFAVKVIGRSRVWDVEYGIHRPVESYMGSYLTQGLINRFIGRGVDMLYYVSYLTLQTATHTLLKPPPKLSFPAKVVMTLAFLYQVNNGFSPLLVSVFSTYAHRRRKSLWEYTPVHLPVMAR